MISAKNMDRVAEELSAIPNLPRSALIKRWTAAHRQSPPKGISRRLLKFSAAYQIQAKVIGGLKPGVRRKLRVPVTGKNKVDVPLHPNRGATLQPGARLVREWHGRTYTVEVTDDGFKCGHEHYASLSQVAGAITGARWSGPRFFGL